MSDTDITTFTESPFDTTNEPETTGFIEDDTVNSDTELTQSVVTEGADTDTDTDTTADKMCSNTDPITLEPFATDPNLVSLRLYDSKRNSFYKGFCIDFDSIKQIVHSDIAFGGPNDTPGYIMSLWSKTKDTMGYGGHPTYNYVFKVPPNNIYITALSLIKILYFINNAKNPTTLYLLPLFGDQPKRIGNIKGIFGVSMTHGQIPGFKVYRVYTQKELDNLTKVTVSPNEFFTNRYNDFTNELVDALDYREQTSSAFTY